MSNKIKLLTLIITFPLVLISQTTEDLEKKKKQVDDKIQELNKISQTIEKKQKNTTSSLNILKKKISLREKSINQTNIDLTIANNEILKNDIQKQNFNKDLIQNKKTIIQLQKNYKETIKQLNIINKSNNMLNYVFASKSLSEAIQRLQYIKQIKRSQQTKYIEINKLNTDIKKNRDNIEQLNQNLQTLQISKQDILKEMNEKNKKQKKDSQEMNKKIQSLKNKKQEVKREIQENKIKSKQLEDKIEEMIALEIEKIKRGESTHFSNTPDYKKYSEDFLSNKSKLPWPVTQGVIIEDFGKHKHPIFDDIEIMNNGVSIATNPKSIIRSVFKGYVASIISIPGQGNSVIISHGDYYTVYSNIEKVFVRQDQKVLTKQEIGVIKQDINGVYKLGFQVWEKQSKLNPADWIYKAY